MPSISGDAAALAAFLVPPKAGEAPPWKGSRMIPTRPHAPTIRDKSVLAAVETTGEGGSLFPLLFLPVGWGCPHP